MAAEPLARCLGAHRKEAIFKAPANPAKSKSLSTRVVMCFLKVFHGCSGVSAIKDIFRDSKPFQSMHQAAALARLNFQGADHCCCRRERENTAIAKAFILTIGVEGQSLPALLAQDSGVHSISLFEKRSALKHLALKFDAYTNRVSSTAILYPLTSLSPDPLARKAFFFHGQ